MKETITQGANGSNAEDASLLNKASESGHNNGEKKNCLKTRDDISPVWFTVSDGKCLVDEEAKCSWINEIDKCLPFKQLRERVEPWLTSLFQSEHLNLLVGSGLTRGICKLANADAADMIGSKFENYGDAIEQAAQKAAQSVGRNDGNFEDRLHVAFDLLNALDLFNCGEAAKLREEIEKKLSEFVDGVLKSETGLLNSPNRVEAFNCLIVFLMSFASRTGNRDRLHIFTTNYDRLIEEAADWAGLRLVDRFVGSLEPVFRASRMNIDFHYNPPGIRGEPRYLEGVARLTKLHGSLDWIKDGQYIRRIGMPFGSSSIKPYLEVRGREGNLVDSLMIYPNSSKDIETSWYPFVELFRDFSAAICRPNSCLVTYGYSFGDDHINRVVRDMLTIPSTHLVIISYDDPLGRIMQFYNQLYSKDQISLILGPNIANLQSLTKDFMPKSAIDFASQRMGRLLQSRLFTAAKSTSPTTNESFGKEVSHDN